MAHGIFREIWQGKSVARAYMNAYLCEVRFEGTILDIGGGRDTKYLSFHPDVLRVETLDAKAGHEVDFEKDRLPFADASYDSVLLFNVLEHVFNYRHLIAETKRALRAGGTLHGFVPFLIKYHPDPHDYFRYTKETLLRLLREEGYADIKVTEVGGGPFIAAAHQIVQVFPRILRIPIFFYLLVLDKALCYIRPKNHEFFPLGYYFRGKKS